MTLWHDIPRDENGLARSLMLGIAMTNRDIPKPVSLLAYCQRVVNDIMAEILPESRRAIIANGAISYIVWMAFDGFSINAGRDEQDADEMVEAFVTLLVGPERVLTGS